LLLATTISVIASIAVNESSIDCALFDRIAKTCSALAAMVAPHLSGQFTMQSDLGHPAGVVVGDYRFGLSPKIWLVARVTQSACDVCRG
jgi:hypothetical protein